MSDSQKASPLNAYLLFLVPLAKAIVAILGRRGEVVIHDLTNRSSLDHTIVAIEGNVTGREVGGPPTDYLLRTLHAGWELEELRDFQVYPGETADGRPLRCASTLIRDESGKVIGALCINVEVTDLLMARAVLNDLCQGAPQKTNLEGPAETFAKDAEQTFESVLKAAAVEVGKPVARMDRQDKIRLVGLVEEIGGFLLRGTAERLARTLGVSRYTIYNYLNEARQTQRSSDGTKPTAY